MPAPGSGQREQDGKEHAAGIVLLVAVVALPFVSSYYWWCCRSLESEVQDLAEKLENETIKSTTTATAKEALEKEVSRLKAELLMEWGQRQKAEQASLDLSEKLAATKKEAETQKDEIEELTSHLESFRLVLQKECSHSPADVCTDEIHGKEAAAAEVLRQEKAMQQLSSTLEERSASLTQAQQDLNSMQKTAAAAEGEVKRLDAAQKDLAKKLENETTKLTTTATAKETLQKEVSRLEDKLQEEFGQRQTAEQASLNLSTELAAAQSREASVRELLAVTKKEAEAAAAEVLRQEKAMQQLGLTLEERSASLTEAEQDLDSMSSAAAWWTWSSVWILVVMCVCVGKLFVYNRKLNGDNEGLRSEHLRLNEPVRRQESEDHNAKQFTDGPKELTDVYDYVVEYDRFQDICTQKGARLSVTPKRDDLLSKDVPSTVVSIMGVFNKGKTTLLRMLTGDNYPTGSTFRTPGICGKLATLDGEREMLVLDTAGTNCPNLESMSSEGRQMKNAEEEFLQHISFALSTVYIFVVEHINAQEVEILQHYCELIQSHASREPEGSWRERKVFIVHNMMHISKQRDLEQHLKTLQRLLGDTCKPDGANVTIEATKLRIAFLTGKLCKVDQTHVVLGREGTEAGQQNEFVIELLKQRITSLNFDSWEKPFPEAVVECCNPIVDDFFQCTNSGKISLDYNDEKQSFTVCTNSGGEVTVKYRYLESKLRSISNMWVPPHHLYTCKGSKYATLFVEVPGLEEPAKHGECSVHINKFQPSGGGTHQLDVRVYKTVPRALLDELPQGAPQGSSSIAHRLNSRMQLTIPFAWGVYKTGVLNGMYYAHFVDITDEKAKAKVEVDGVKAIVPSTYEDALKESQIDRSPPKPKDVAAGLGVDIQPSAPHLDPLGILACPEDHRASPADAEIPPSGSDVPDFFEKPAGTVPGDRISY